ncbi:MAG: Vps62-related protein [Acidimicrobiales bacterium]
MRIRREQFRGTNRMRLAITLALFLGTLFAQIPGAGAEDLADVDPEAALELAEKYVPIMMLKAQEAACDPKGEPYGPTAADIVLDNPEILLRQVGPGNPVITTGPSGSELFGLSEGFFLDFPGGALEPGCIYEKDFQKYSDGTPAVVYAHIVQQDDHPDQLALQYWFYWYYNDWNNKHEGDWEGIQLLFSASSIEDALATEPTSIGYAQHEGGEIAEWDSSKLERDGSHPMVFSSAGSHASYFGSAVYLGRSGSEGFGCDNTDGPSNRVEPEVVVLPDSVTDPTSSLAWLGFDGRWGERQGGPFNGPTGPTAKGRWLEPIDWHEELRPSSVVIPAGDSFGASVISGFCGVVEWGSGTLISFTTSPSKVIIGFGLLFLMISWLTRRTDWTRVAPLPLRRRRQSGQIIRVAGAAYATDTRSLLTFGLFYLPAAIVGLILTSLVAIAPVVKDVLGASQGSTGSDLVLSLVVGGIPNIIALVFVNAGVAVYLDRANSPDPISAGDAARLAWSKRTSLGSGLLRASAVVGVLLLSVVGTPIAIYQLIRYQFMPHAIMLEDLDGKSGLARSSDLVRGRWLHTTLFLLAFNGLVLAASLAVGILLLVVFNQVPLILFSTLMTLFAALIAPLSAYALTLLYGDAIAQQTGAGRADRVTLDPLVADAIA